MAIIGADYTYPQTTVEFFEQYAPEFGLELGYRTLVPLGTDNFTPELNNINDDEVDALFLPYPGANGVTLIQQIRENGLFEDNIILGDYGYGSNPYLSALQEQIVGVNNWGADLTTGRSQELSEKVNDRFDNRMGIYHALGYDTARVIAQSINQADELSPQAVRDVIASTEFTETASGWGIKFGENGHNVTYRMIVNQWERQGGELQNLRRFRSDVIPPTP